MPKKCPPGIICIENFSFAFISIIMGIILLFMWIKYSRNIDYHSNMNTYYQPQFQPQHKSSYFDNLISFPSSSFSTAPNDILLNPYSEPVRDDRIFNTSTSFHLGHKVPINVPTQSFDTNYRQIGILTRTSGGEMILPLMGRPLFTNRDKWNFYTMNDKNPMIKLPVKFKNKSCSSEQGCDNVYNGDIVYVEGYNDTFKVTVYENNVMRYLPYLYK